MGRAGFVSIVATGIMVSASAAVAQDLSRAGPPAETPPASYTSNQYVDSRGCVYIRAGIGGTTTWVPRVNQQRRVLCGFTPTIARPAPEPEPPVVTATPEPAAPPRTTQTATAAPTRTAPAPVTRAPVAAPTPTAAPRSPVITRVTGTSVIASPPLTRPTTQAPASTPAATPAAARMTRSQFCADRFGLQPGFISSRTGETIDCGPRPAAPAVTQAAAVVAPTAPPAPGVRRATRSEICEEIRTTGRQFVNAATGLPVRCPTTAPAPTTVRGPFNPSTATVAASTCTSFTNGDPTRCGNTVQVPVFSGTLRVSTMTTTTSTRSVRNPFNRPVPASNPTNVRNLTPSPPSGYERVWSDGRLNVNRGPQPPAQLEVHVSSRTVAPQTVTAPSQPYVQIGTFLSRDQAQNVAKGLRSRGLPMRIAVFTRDGQEHRIVLAGPFPTQAAVNSALGQVRGLGYGNARPASY